MKKITLIYEQQDEKPIQESILPLFSQHDISLECYTHKNISGLLIDEGAYAVVYLSEKILAIVLSEALDRNWTVGILPHPGSLLAQHTYGISPNLEEAVEDILTAKKPVKADIMICNEQIVFNKVVIGDTLRLMSDTMAKKDFLSRISKPAEILRHINYLIPQAYTITANNKEPVTTAVVGIVAILNGKSSILSRQLLRDYAFFNGRLHILLLAPRSIAELLRFSFTSVFTSQVNRKVPSFIGHIRTRSVKITSETPVDYSLDGRLMRTTEINLRVNEQKLLLLPGRHLSREEEAGESEETYKISALPKGEAYLQELVGKPLSLIYHASTEQFKELFTVLRENSKPTSPYMTLMLLSTLLATFGLFSNSSPVIIGAMILAPLMAPIISMSMGVLRQDRSLIAGSARTIGYGLLIGYLAAIFITLITPLQIVNQEISARIRPNLLDLGVAIVSGIAGAYAHAREEVAKTLAGVAIAVALVPPLAVSGIGLAWLDWQIFIGALLLLLTNLTGIVLAGSITFMLLGFSPFKLAKKGLLISLSIVLLISLPLGFGFISMVREHNIIRTLNNSEVDDILIKEVAILRGGNPLNLSVRLVTQRSLTDGDLEKVKQAIQEKTGREVQLEIIVSMRR